jgi:hypothetical protein
MGAEMLATTRVTVIVLAATALVAAGCGQSAQDKAQKKVCDARADIRKQVDELTSLTATTATVNGVRDGVTAIRDDLERIGDAQGTLSDKRRTEVQQATKAFTDEVGAIAQGLTGNLTLSEAGTQLQAAAKRLGAAYAQSLGKINCG